MYQKITILGRVGNDAELRFTPDGTAVASFSLASNETWKKDGQKQERTTWHRCSLWRGAAEALAQHITKGKIVLVEGTVVARAYLDKDGNAQASLEVKVDQFRFGGGGDIQSQQLDNVHVEDSASIPF